MSQHTEMLARRRAFVAATSMRMHLRAALMLGLLTMALPAAAIVPVESLGRILMPAVDIAATLRADQARGAGQPFRFAVPIATALTPATAGSWETLADGRALWRAKFYSAGASSLNFGFSSYLMPSGGTLRIYAPDGSQQRGPYTDAHNNAAGQLWTPLIEGSEAVIELIVPAASRQLLQLQLAQVGHGFRGIKAKSGDCNIDVACSDADAWRNEIRSVTQFTIAGVLACSGQLVNNTAQDLTPYVLTASHCVPSHALAPTTVYYWNFQTSHCGGTPDGSLDQSSTGAVMVATSALSTEVGSDFALMRLQQQPDPAYKLFYSGWDNGDSAPHGVTGIHHPNGDEMRISFDNDLLEITSYLGAEGSGSSHLRVGNWERGVTEGGSSGSGIWNREHLLVGTLSGGESSCEVPDGADWYGRFEQHWSALPTPLTSVASWLDPAGTGEQKLAGVNADGTPATQPVRGSGSSGSGSSGGGGAMSLLVMLALLALRLGNQVLRTGSPADG